jgi:tetratricopeptide (TPR) repeat protein
MLRILLLSAVVLLQVSCRNDEAIEDNSYLKAVVQSEEYLQKGTYILESDPQRAFELLTKSIQEADDWADPYYYRSIALMKMNRLREANSDITRVEDLDPPNGKLLRRLYLAQKNFVEGEDLIASDPAKAIDFLTKSKDYDDSQVVTFCRRASAFSSLRKIPRGFGRLRANQEIRG